jgi:hypothetical protein
MRTRAHGFVCRFERRDGLLALDGRKRVEKLFKAVAGILAPVLLDPGGGE